MFFSGYALSGVCARLFIFAALESAVLNFLTAADGTSKSDEAERIRMWAVDRFMSRLSKQVKESLL
ncbi:MAG: hypothetical protein K2M80_02115, partial [Muribaculaceae bacterium]|nr:hypothetical protein [Muribaculaceae bacterium]